MLQNDAIGESFGRARGWDGGGNEAAGKQELATALQTAVPRHDASGEDVHATGSGLLSFDQFIGGNSGDGWLAVVGILGSSRPTPEGAGDGYWEFSFAPEDAANSQNAKYQLAAISLDGGKKLYALIRKAAANDDTARPTPDKPLEDLVITSKWVSLPGEAQPTAGEVTHKDGFSTRIAEEAPRAGDDALSLDESQAAATGTIAKDAAAGEAKDGVFISGGLFLNDVDLNAGTNLQITKIAQGDRDNDQPLAASAEGATQNVVKAVPAGGNVTIKGKYGTLTIYSNGDYAYEGNGRLADGEVGQEVFTYEVWDGTTGKDGERRTDRAKLEISVTGKDDAPQAEAKDNTGNDMLDSDSDAVQLTLGDLLASYSDIDLNAEGAQAHGRVTFTITGFAGAAVLSERKAGSRSTCQAPIPTASRSMSSMRLAR